MAGFATPESGPRAFVARAGSVDAGGQAGFVLWSRLLLVEDDDGDALLETELLAAGVPAGDVRRAVSLAEARLIIESGWKPEVMLVDLGLPDAGGASVVEQLMGLVPDAALVVLTGLRDEASGLEAVAAGAQDYLVKGHVDSDLLTRSIRYGLGRKRVEESQHRLIASELRAMENRRLERGLLPKPRLRDQSLRVHTGYQPGGPQSLLGGDFYDVIEANDGALHVVLGDVSGHGPDEAALGVLLRAAWRALVLARTPIAEVLPLLAGQLRTERRSEDVFATAVYLVASPDRDRFELFNAGHPRPLSLATVPQVPWPEMPGLPLGMGEGPWVARSYPAAELWPLLLYTDGLVEGRSGAGRLQEEGLLALVGDELSRGCPVADLIPRLISRAEAANGGPLVDDVAMLIIDPGGVEERMPRRAE